MNSDFPYVVELDSLQERFERGVFQPAHADDLTRLQDLGVPAKVRRFYAAAEPRHVIESEGVFLLPIAKIAVATTANVPGLGLYPNGYVVIATTVSGDAYCIATYETHAAGHSPVYIANHERVSENATHEQVQANIHFVAPTFREFLARFAEGSLPYDYFQAIRPNNR